MAVRSWHVPTNFRPPLGVPKPRPMTEAERELYRFPYPARTVAEVDRTR